MLAEAKRFEKNYATAYGVNVSTITYPSSGNNNCIFFLNYLMSIFSSTWLHGLSIIQVKC